MNVTWSYQPKVQQRALGSQGRGSRSSGTLDKPPDQTPTRATTMVHRRAFEIMATAALGYSVKATAERSSWTQTPSWTSSSTAISSNYHHTTDITSAFLAFPVPTLGRRRGGRGDRGAGVGTPGMVTSSSAARSRRKQNVDG